MVHTQNFENAVVLTEEGVRIGAKHEILLCASLFYFRLPRAVWKDRIARLKAVGYNCVDVYFPWNYHERADGSFDFSGERDVRCFLQALKEAGLYVIVRPGPYICSEWNGGGLPARILESDIPIRCADERFLSEVEKWYGAILPEIAPFTYGNGGTVILLQLENELDFFDCPDPRAYIGRLHACARKYCADIPHFCCAGQYGVVRAGAIGCEGVEGTLNCYPESLDPTFDAELQAYAFRFRERHKPLLVSETNRDHFLLRRELSCGAKLLGAYNQVAGNNFGYDQAINNWGTPDSFITTVYDFESMIDAAGAYRAEAAEAVLFSAFLKVAGEALARAIPANVSILPQRCAFTTTEGGLRVLTLANGGKAVCVPNFGGSGEISFDCDGKSVTAEVPEAHAPFFLFGFDLSACGIPAVLTRANCEPVFAEAGKLVFVAEGTPCVGLDFGEGEVLLSENTALCGTEIVFMDRKGALGFLTNGEPPLEKQYFSAPISAFSRAECPAWRSVSAEKGTHFGALGITEGEAEYEVKLPAGTALFVEHPCDMLRVTADGVRGETYFADGRDVVVPASKSGVYRVGIRKWGHCNFDDPQSPSLRTASKKGALSFGAVREEVINRCDFRLLDAFGEGEIALTGGMPVRIGVNKWNSTRKPVICSYTLGVTRTAERLLVKTTEAVDVAVYLDGKKLGLCEYGTFELTPFVARGETRTLTVVYRKQVWTQNVGTLRLLHVDTVAPVSVRVRTAKELCGKKEGKEALALPLSADEAAFTLPLPKKEGYLKFAGKNMLVTCVAGGRVVGRLLLGWEHAPKLEGGDPALLYVCPAWGETLYLHAEALGKDARLERVEYLSVR